MVVCKAAKCMDLVDRASVLGSAARARLRDTCPAPHVTRVTSCLPHAAQEPIPCCFEMLNGVMRVWADESREQELWAPPGSPTDFFSGGGRLRPAPAG